MFFKFIHKFLCECVGMCVLCCIVLFLLSLLVLTATSLLLTFHPFNWLRKLMTVSTDGYRLVLSLLRHGGGDGGGGSPSYM